MKNVARSTKRLGTTTKMLIGFFLIYLIARSFGK